MSVHVIFAEEKQPGVQEAVVKKITDDETTVVNEESAPFAYASYEFVQMRMSRIAGKILTIIDASVPEKQQNKAVKDLIRNEFASEYGELYQMMCKEDHDATMKWLDDMDEKEYNTYVAEGGTVEVSDVICPDK